MIGDKWAVIRKLKMGGDAHEYFNTEQDARDTIDRKRSTATRSAGKNAGWWVEDNAEFIQSESFGRHDSISRAEAIRATLAARKRSIKSFEEGVSLQQIPSRARKKYKLTTDSNHHQPVFANVLARQFAVTEPDVAYVGDITYL